MKSYLTECGLPGIGAIPYGFHMCHFYASRLALLDGLKAYFAAGLRKNERCVWITTSLLPVAEIRDGIARLPNLLAGLESGQLSVFDASDWYGDPSALDAEASVARWIDEEERALLDGFAGLRITGNASFVPRDHWDSLMEYEERLHEGLNGRRILASCAYHRAECRPVDVMEVVQRHHAVLEKGSNHWDVLLPESRYASTRAM